MRSTLTSWFEGPPARCACIVLSVSMLIVACGSGMGYSAGNGPAPAAPGTGTTPPPGTGAAAPPSSMAIGAITSFGSVILNGVEYQTNDATISINGRSSSQGDLRIGYYIRVKGHHDDGANLDIADEIDFRADVEGPVTAIDTTGKTLVVLGQTVIVSAETSFDDNISPAALAGLAVGDIVEVSGMRAPDGALHATRIEKQAASAGLQVVGVAGATDATGKLLKINALTVDFSAATLVDFGGSSPKDGELLEAVGSTLDSNGVLRASSLELLSGRNFTPAPHDNMRVAGLITRFAAATDFDIAGQSVSTTASTVFDGGAVADLALNVSVEVEGSVNAEGVLVAARVQIRRPADIRIAAQVDAVDENGGTIELLGTRVDVNYLTRFEDHGSQRLSTFKLHDIQVGDWLEVRGTASAANSGSITATRIDRCQPQSRVQLLGPVDVASQPNFKVLETNVNTSGATQFNNGLTVGAFFSSTLVGKIVSVEGTWDGSVLTALRVTLGDDDDGGDDSGPGHDGGDGSNSGPGGGGDGGGSGGGDGGGSGGDGGPGPG